MSENFKTIVVKRGTVLEVFQVPKQNFDGDALSELLDVADRDPDVQIKVLDGPTVVSEVQAIRDRLLKRETILGELRTLMDPDKSFVDRRISRDHIVSSCLDRGTKVEEALRLARRAIVKQDAFPFIYGQQVTFKQLLAPNDGKSSGDKLSELMEQVKDITSRMRDRGMVVSGVPAFDALAKEMVSKEGLKPGQLSTLGAFLPPPTGKSMINFEIHRRNHVGNPSFCNAQRGDSGETCCLPKGHPETQMHASCTLGRFDGYREFDGMGEEFKERILRSLRSPISGVPPEALAIDTETQSTTGELVNNRDGTFSVLSSGQAAITGGEVISVQEDKSPGWIHIGEPFEIERDDEVGLFETDDEAVEAHRKECGCPWPEFDYQDAIMSWIGRYTISTVKHLPPNKDGVILSGGDTHYNDSPILKEVQELCADRQNFMTRFEDIVAAFTKAVDLRETISDPKQREALEGAFKLIKKLITKRKDGTLNPYQFSTVDDWMNCSCGAGVPPGKTCHRCGAKSHDGR